MRFLYYLCAVFAKKTMKKSVLLLLLLCSLSGYGTTHVTYTPDEQTIFPNPERGFTDELGGETRLSDDKNHVVKGEEWYFEQYGDRRSLVMLMYYLYNFKSSDISAKVLKGFDEDMEVLRENGFKCILRFAYDWKKKNDASLAWVQRHIEQLKPYWEKNADVIYAFEAGFVGEWGEWYYSSNFGNETQHLNADRRAVIDALLAAVPADRFILVRYPLIKIEYFGDENTLTAEEAFSGTARARLGHHNDAFLNTYGNEGTYGRDGDGPDDDPVLRRYIAAETQYVPNGGETNVEKESLASQVYADAPAEMSTYHWSFCGSEYAEQVTDKWRSSGIFDQLDRKMGYRIEMVSADLPETAHPGGQTTVQIAVRNVGYAPLYNARPVYFVLRDQYSVFSIQLAADPRRWAPNGASSTIHETVTIPAEIPEGTYQLYLHLPDAYASLAADPRYAVRFANSGTWDEATGMNSLQATIEIRANEGQSIHAAEAADSRWTKDFRNGQLVLRRGEQTKTILGQEL